MTYQLRYRDGSGTIVSPVLPTIRLLDEGWRPVQAYESAPATDQYPPVWRVRDDSYDPKGTEYVLVTVERVPEPDPFSYDPLGEAHEYVR